MDTSLVLLTLVVGFAAGCLRGFAGFGGPAFVLAVLTWFMTPAQVIDKVLVLEFVATGYLVWAVRDNIDWKTTGALTVPTLLSMPAGHWLLLNTDPLLISRAISVAILVSCVLMLVNVRLPFRLPVPVLILVGLFNGVVIGASYIALLLVAMILMGAYDRKEVRTLLVSCSFAFAVWYLLLSVSSGRTDLASFAAAIPMTLAYFGGSWLGASHFKHSTEAGYRQFALVLLMILAVVGLTR